jgi:hypothetical protein
VTRPSKKSRERFLAEEAGKLLCRNWKLRPDCESPDFIVTEGEKQFGLEVIEIFIGPQSRSGSTTKRMESDAQHRVNAIRREYEAIANIALRVQFVGDISTENLETVVPALLAEDFASKPIAHHIVVDEGRGLRVHATKVFRAEWFYVNDRVGWVDRGAIRYIADAVERKAGELQRYMKAAGSDIRLLIVADRILNSGKLVLDERAPLDLHGFRVVYFYSRPETVVVFD